MGLVSSNFIPLGHWNVPFPDFFVLAWVVDVLVRGGTRAVLGDSRIGVCCLRGVES